MSIKLNIRVCFAIVVITTVPLYADFGWDDSPQFSLNLLTLSSSYSDSLPFALNVLSVPPNGYYTFGDSPSFNMNLCFLNRHFSDSSSFAFDWLANSHPSAGPERTPPYCPPDDLLEQYDKETNQWVSRFSFPDVGQAVIVLNHGWNSEPDKLLGIAEAIASRLPGIHIYTWNWSDFPERPDEDANPNELSTDEDFAALVDCIEDFLDINGRAEKCLCAIDSFKAELLKSKSNAATQGNRLGNSLLAHGISPDFYKIHLIGSSYGGVVCAEAANVLKTSGSQVQQITTLDTPSIYVHALEEYIKPELAERVEVLYYDWKEDGLFGLAKGATGGPLKTNATNVLNLELNSSYCPECTANDYPLHFFISDWYQESVPGTLNCESEPYGFGWSTSIDPEQWQWNDWPLGNKRETFDPYGKGCMTPEVALFGKDLIVGAKKSWEDFKSAASWVGNKAELFIDSTKDAFSSVKLKLQEISPFMEGQFIAYAQTESSNDPNIAYIYKQIDIPAGTDEIALDVRFSAVGLGDELTVSVEDEVLIVIDAAAEGVSDTYKTHYASVSDYAGQSAVVQIALLPTGTGESEVLVDNLRFLNLTLVEDITGDKSVDMEDLMILAENWLVVGCDYRDHCDGADINRDNKVDFKDFSRLASFWLESF